MWIVSASNLSESELSLLGNNIRPSTRLHRRSPNVRANQRVIAAVNRSLAGLDERVSKLHQRRDQYGVAEPARLSLAL